MKHFFLYCLLFIFCNQNAEAQAANLYYSQQSSKASSFNGNYSKQTDRYEQANITLSTQGPLTYTIDPSSYSIYPNESKSWSGSVTIDYQKAPAPGSQVTAQLIADYTVQYSRPYGLGSSGTVLSTYSCGDSSGVGGCIYHNGKPGVHEIVSDNGTYTKEFNVISIKVSLPDTIYLEPGGQNYITATSYPADAGTFAWHANNANVKITNADQQTATIELLDTTLDNAEVTVTYTIDGVSYQGQSFLAEEKEKPADGKKKPPFVVRLQAQGGGVEESVVLSGNEPITVAEALAGLEKLKAKLSKKELKAREDCFDRAERFIKNAPAGGGVGPPGKSFSLPKSDIRVDVEVIRGTNFKK